MIDNIINIISNSVQSAMGQIFNSDRKRYYKLQEAFEVYYLAIVFSLLAVTSILILPFMKLYTAGADINYVDWKLMVLFGLYQLMSYGRVTSNQIISYAGAFRETRTAAILEAVINLAVSLICVFKFGIYGVLIGTVAALIYRSNDIILYANRKIMKRSAWPTYRRWLIDFIIFIVLVAGFLQLPISLDSYVMFFLNAIWITIVVFTVFVAINTAIEREARETAWMYLKNILNKVIAKVKNNNT